MPLQPNDLVQTLYTPSQQGRTVCVPTGSVGRIEEKYHGLWEVKFSLPLVTSDGALFFYDEEKEAIGCFYQTNELRRVADSMTQNTLVWLVPEQDSVAIYNVSRWDGLLDSSLQSTLETCSLLHTHMYDPYRPGDSVLFQALLYCFEQGYYIQNIKKFVFQEMLKDCIWAFQCYIMDKERPFSDALNVIRSQELAKNYHHTKERSVLDSQLLPYKELAYLFMDASDETKTQKPTFKNELSLLTGRIEALESICQHLSKHAQEQTIERLALYYRAQAVLHDWRNICR